MVHPVPWSLGLDQKICFRNRDINVVASLASTRICFNAEIAVPREGAPGVKGGENEDIAVELYDKTARMATN